MSEDDGPRVHERSHRVLHTGRVGSFGLHELEFPDGSRFTLELLRHPGASAVVPMVDATRVLLLRQYRFAAGGVIWEIPAGKRDAGETAEQCATRELEEETGYRPGRLVHTGRILTTPGFTDEVIELFCAYDLEPGTLAREPNEWMELATVSLEEARAMIDRGDITDSKSIAGLYHAFRLAG